MPTDMAMYWTEIDGGSWYEPRISAPIWEFVDEDEAPEAVSFVDEIGLVLVG